MIVLKIIGKIIKWFLLGLLAVVVFFYITCPIYDFPEQTTFTGSNYYNPYEDVDSNYWRRGNFQIQSHAWFGITGGSKNSSEVIDSIYSMLDYDIIAISDYMKLNTYHQGRPEYIPVYEHGYGIRKFHQVCIGSDRVQWRDYPIFQNKHHKQHILNILKEKNDLVFIAHPRLRFGYKAEEMRYLSGYDGVEVLNYMRFSPEHWDAALSTGKYVTILGNDDGHDIEQPLEIGHRCTYIYSPHLIGDSVVSAMKQGKHYGVDVYRTAEENIAEKALKAPFIAKLAYLKMSGDTLKVGFNKTVDEFRFVGQDAQILHKDGGSPKSFYVIQPEDTYVRVEATFPDRNVFYLNPVAKYDDTLPGNPMLASINWLKTGLFWGLSWSIVFLSLFVYIRKKMRKRRKPW